MTLAIRNTISPPFTGTIGDRLTCEAPVHADDIAGVRLAWCGGIEVPDGTDAGAYLARLYATKGIEFPKEITGNFAIAGYDPSTRRPFLIRDAAGTIPLYYTRGSNGEIRFSTVLRDLINTGDRHGLNPEALLDFLTFFWSLRDKTFFKGIHGVPQGTALVDGECRQWYSFEHGPEKRDGDYWRETVVEALRHAAGRSLGARVGCHLSGGIDSSVITVLVNELLGKPPETFAASFPDYPEYDESPYGQLVAENIGAPFHRATVAADDFRERFSEMVRAVEEPKCHPPVFARFMLEECSRRYGCSRIITGRGADELFTGYDSHRAGQLINHRARRTVFSAEQRGLLLRPEFLREQAYSPEDEYDSVFAQSHEDAPLARVLKLDFHGLLNNWLALDFKISSHFGGEIVHPFLDREVMDLALRIPLELKCPGDDPKRLLKDAVRRLLPDSLLSRKKVGFRTPMSEMLRAGLEPYARDVLHEDASPFFDWFDPAGVRSVVDSHFSGQRNWGWQVWALMCVREWCRLFVENSGYGR